MQKKVYGIDRNHAHPRALELVKEDFFWDPADDLAPFGSDDGDTAYFEYQKWREKNPDAPLKDCLIWTIESVGEVSFEDYNDKILSKEKIREQVFSEDFDDYQYIFTLDISVIATGFGQLVDEGKIDNEAKPIILLAINRLLLWSESLLNWEHAERFIKNLKLLIKILDKA